MCIRAGTGAEGLRSTVRFIHLDGLLHVLYAYAMSCVRAPAMLCCAVLCCAVLCNNKLRL